MESESDADYNTEEELEYARSFEKPLETEVLENGTVIRKPRKVVYPLLPYALVQYHAYSLLFPGWVLAVVGCASRVIVG